LNKKVPETYVDGYGNKYWIWESGIAICINKVKNARRDQVESGEAVKYSAWYDKYQDLVRVGISTHKGYKLVMDEKYFHRNFRIFTRDKESRFL